MNYIFIACTVCTIHILTAPSSVPVNIRLTVESSSTMTVSWEPPPLESHNGQLSYYDVLITETEVMNLESGTVVLSEGMNSSRIYELSEGRTQLVAMLHPSYRYSVEVAAATSAGVGPYSPAMSVVMLEAG